MYSPEAIEETEYKEVLSTLLAVVRDAGFRKGEPGEAEEGLGGADEGDRRPGR